MVFSLRAPSWNLSSREGTGRARSDHWLAAPLCSAHVQPSHVHTVFFCTALQCLTSGSNDPGAVGLFCVVFRLQALAWLVWIGVMFVLIAA